MAESAAARSAERLRPSDRAGTATSPRSQRASVVFLIVLACLAATAGIYGTPEAASASRPQCNNRIDDDGDGKIDYPNDPGCASKRDRSEIDPVQPPPPPPPPPACSDTAGGGAFKGCYYNNQDFTEFVLERTDQALAFDWGSGSPDPQIGQNTFSVRWRGEFLFDAATYTFTVRADDGVRLFVDGELVIDHWIDQAPTTYTAQRAMNAGQHVIRVDYYENDGGAVLEASWATQGQPPPGGSVIQPGQSWNAAYQGASCGQVFSLGAGMHPAQTIVENPALNSCAQSVTFQATPGTVTITGKVKLGSCFGCYSQDVPSHIVLRGFAYTESVEAWGDGADILLDDLDGGGIVVEGINGFTVRNSDLGPCNSSPPGDCARVMVLDYGANPTRTRNLLFEDNVIHGFVINQDGDHWECVFASGGINVTWRRNKFWNCRTYAMALGGGGHNTGIYDNWLIENNWIGRTCCLGDADRWSALVLGDRFQNALIRFNSFAGGQTINTEGGFGSGRNVRAVGNILGEDGNCVTGVTYVQNLIRGDQICAAGNELIGQMPYVNPDNEAAMDYHLVPGSPAEGFVTSTSPDASIADDWDGQSRAVPRDAGSDER